MMTLSVSPETVVFNNYQDWEVTACTYTSLSLKELSLIFDKNWQQSTISQETQNIMSKSLGGGFYCNFFFREKHWLFIFKHFFPLTSLSPKKIRHLWMSYVIKTIYATLWFFFFPVLFILWSNLLQHLQDSHQQNTIFFWTKLNLRDNVVWWEVATVHLQNGCSAYMWYRRCQWSYTVAAYCSFGWTSVTRGETNIKVHTHTFYRYSTLHTPYTLHFIYAHIKRNTNVSIYTCIFM